MSDLIQRLERTVHQLTGRPVEELRRLSIDELRAEVVRRKGRFKIRREYPFIGRGNVMADSLVDHDEVEREFAGAVGK